jgi:hypothetical protein
MFDPLSENTISQYKKLPIWCKDLLKAVPCYEYSGSDILGWEIKVFGPPMSQIGSRWGEQIPTNPSEYFVAAGRDILGFEGSQHADLAYHSELGIYLFGYEHDGNKIKGSGYTKLEAAMDLFYNSYRYYMDFLRPTITDMDDVLIDSFMDRDNHFSIEVRDNMYTYGLCEDRKYKNFMLEPNRDEGDCQLERYHGTIQLVEGIARVYTNYGKLEHPPVKAYRQTGEDLLFDVNGDPSIIGAGSLVSSIQSNILTDLNDSFANDLVLGTALEAGGFIDSRTGEITPTIKFEWNEG